VVLFVGTETSVFCSSVHGAQWKQRAESEYTERSRLMAEEGPRSLGGCSPYLSAPACSRPRALYPCVLPCRRFCHVDPGNGNSSAYRDSGRKLSADEAVANRERTIGPVPAGVGLGARNSASRGAGILR
jgi:hypothetical protein